MRSGDSADPRAAYLAVVVRGSIGTPVTRCRCQAERRGQPRKAFAFADRVSVTAGQSLVLPILDRGLPATRIDLYQSSVDQHHPLAAIDALAYANVALGGAGRAGAPGLKVSRLSAGGSWIRNFSSATRLQVRP